MSIQIRPQDFGEWDREAVDLAGAQLLAEVADIAYHCTNPGEGWQPFTEGDTAALIAEVRGHVERLEAATKAARRELAAVERTARLAAYRRIKQEEHR